MNMAALWQFPVIYVCENNRYGEYTRMEEVTAGDTRQRGEALGVPSTNVDGMDVRDVYYREEMADIADIYGVRTEMAGPVESDFPALGQEFQEVLAQPETAGLFAYTGDIGIMQPFYDEAAEKGIPIVDGAVPWREPRVAFIGAGNQFQVPLAGDLLVEQEWAAAARSPRSEAEFSFRSTERMP